MNQAQAYCGSCGRENDPSNKFCAHCGAPVHVAAAASGTPPPPPAGQRNFTPPPPPPAAPPPMEKNRRMPCTILVIVFACLCLGSLAAMWFYGDPLVELVQAFMEGRVSIQ